MNLLISLPSWATSPEAQAWVYGFGAGALVRITRAALRWFKRTALDSPTHGD